MNNKGFTLIELLATIALLAVLMIIAVPNVVGVVNRNKNKTYIEDAKKLVSLTEYKVRSKSEYKPSSSSGSYCFKMKFLGTEEFASAPNGGCYDEDNSYVKVTWSSNKLKYQVQLAERSTCDKDASGNYSSGYKSGIPLLDNDKLFESDSTKYVAGSGFTDISCTKTF